MTAFTSDIESTMCPHRRDRSCAVPSREPSEPPIARPRDRDGGPRRRWLDERGPGGDDDHMLMGVATFPTDRSMPPDELASAVEARGLSSLFVAEHTHMPVVHTTFPGGLPDEYRRTLDPFVALTAAATTSHDLLLGTSICLIAQHDPIILAKQAASLDVLSNGRVTLGVGFGWNVPETQHHGVAWHERRAVVRESVAALRVLWTEEVASFDGHHVRFAPSWSWPKPTQQPHIPVLLGAELGPQSTQAVIAEFEGWMPLGANSALQGIRRLRADWHAAGRDGRPTVHVCERLDDVDEDALTRLADADVDHVSILVPSEARPGVLPLLDRCARLAESIRS